MALRARNKGLEIVCNIDSDVPVHLKGDPGRLRQILTNLMGNAIKFTHQGEVVIHVSPIPENAEHRPETGVNGHGDDVFLRFSVRDTGIGIPADKIDLIFQDFTQADASTTREYGGTGLGLAISKQLAGLMGGEIGVDSLVGKGSTFWFTAHLKRQSGISPEQTPPATDLKNVRVLIVDDNATNRRILTTRLSSWGMRACETPDGASAIEALLRASDGKDPFRIALIDMQMPGMDGESLGRAIMADERIADTRMVMLTSIGSRADAPRLEKIGFLGYLNKPIRHQELRTVISHTLAKRNVGTMNRQSASPPLDFGNLFAGTRSRILLAEDNITNQQVALGILKKFGLRADAVATGTEVLSALETLPYDLILMDVQMPVMDGLETARRIRSIEAERAEQTANSATGSASAPIPIIALTAHATLTDREKCLEAGMDDYLSKPISPQALADRLVKWLPGNMAEPSPAPDTSKPETTPPEHCSDLPVWNKANMLDREIL